MDKIMSDPHILAARFQKDAYVLAKSFLSSDVCALATRYSHLKREIDPNKEDSQVPGAYSVYGDTLMESLLDLAWHQIEEIIGDQLWPTYTYYRVYQTGAVLLPHVDRASAEISASICLGFDYSNLPSDDYNWALFLQPPPAGAFPDERSNIRECRMEPGDMLVYRGQDLMHWRESFRGLWQVQVFLHYVRKNGEYSSAKYDGRPMLGQPPETKNWAQAVRIANLDKARVMRYLRQSDNLQDVSFQVLR
jgi:hypothetical protein